MAGLRLGSGNSAPIMLVSKTVTVESNNGDIISVINKTGDSIAVNDKVWINRNTQTANTAYFFKGDTQTSTYRGIISNSGDYGYCDGKVYSVSADSTTELMNGCTSTSRMRVVYGPNDLTFVGDIGLTTTSSSCGLGTAYSNFASSVTSYVATNGSSSYIYSVDPNTYAIKKISTNGTVSHTWTYNTNILMPMCPFMIGSTIYSYQCTSNAMTYYTLDESVNTYSASNFSSTIGHVIGVTSDSKYIISGNNSDDLYGAVGALKIYSVNSSTTPATFTEITLPSIMSYYSTASNSTSAYVFNPHNNILTAVDWRDTSNVMVKVFRYLPSTESWEEVSIVLPDLTGLYFCGCLTLSEDLSRGCLNLASTSNASSYVTAIINFTTVSNYAAVPYRYYTITENTLVGKATSAGVIGGNFNVATIVI